MFRILAAVATAGLLAPAPARAHRPDPPVNQWGLPVVDGRGERILYGRDELEAAGRQAAPPSPLLPSGVTARWGYAGFGSGIGLSNIVLSDGEIITGGSILTFGANDYFYVLRPAGNGYEQVFVSRQFPALVALGVADVVGDARKEIVVVQENGNVALFDQRTREETGGFTAPFGDITSVLLHDLDANGKAELLVTTDDFSTDRLYVLSGAGAVLWQLAGAGGYDVTVGNMDADPSPEIATTAGIVADWDTRTVQWTRPQGFGFDVDVGDIDGDGKQELIAAQAWDFIWAFDVDTQLPKWSLSIFNVGAIAVRNVDADPTLELIVGEAQWGDVKAFDTVTLAEEWAIPNPEHGVTYVAFGDPNGNGVLDVLWGSGASSTGSDRLYVANLATHTIDWENVQLEGQFVAPQQGDIDGDGLPEIVSASWESESGYDSGRIAVFDAQTLRLRALSPGVVNNSSWEGLHDLRLRNVDADPQLEIVIAADDTYDGVIEIYDFAAPSTFTRIWTNTVQPSGSPFFAADVADVDGDGALEVVGSVGRAHTGSPGTFVYVYSLATGLEEWHSFALTTGWLPADGLALLTAGGGVADIVVMVGGESLSFFTGTGQVQAIVPGTFRYLAELPGGSPRAFVTGGDGGEVRQYERQGSGYSVVWSRSVGGGAVDGVSFVEGGKMALTSAGRLTLYPTRTAPPAWTSEDYGVRGATLVGSGAARRPFLGGQYAVVSLAPWRTLLDVQPPTGPYSGGTLLTVTGTAFDPAAGLFVGGRETVGTVISGPTQATGTTPPLVQCSANDVLVLNPDMSFEIAERAFAASCGPTCPVITINPPAVPAATAGASYSQAFVQSGGSGPITWSLTGTLPTGLSFDAAMAVLSGTPLQVGNFPITVRATDGGACVGTRDYTLVVGCQAITVNPPSVPPATAGTPYAQQFSQAGGLGAITWALTGTLPAGLVFNPGTASLSGTPAQVGSFPFSVGATDGNACSGLRAYTLLVGSAGPFAAAALAADASGNGVLEPGEAITIAPSWHNGTGAAATVTGAASSFTGPGGSLYAIPDAAANYGTVPAGATASCTATGDCYVLGVFVADPRPALHWEAAFLESLSSGDSKGWTIHIGGSFSDVATGSPFYRFIETLLHRGVTGGCGSTSYCPVSSTTRDQMAVFVLVAKEGAGYVPPVCGTPLFGDVPASSPYCRWIEELARRGVVGGCGGGNYCPTSPATREAMAVFVLRTLDPALNPPACTTPIFGDVPASSPFCRWIEELARRGVMSGCGGGNYCPTAAVSREQMSVFLTATFGLTLYGI
jgi:hypothetical protein